MAKNKLLLGFWSRQLSNDPIAKVKWVEDNGYEGVMVYLLFEDISLMEKLANALYGPGNWNEGNV